jgi:hypothetical protein
MKHARTMLSWPRADEANPYVLRLVEALTRRGVRVRSERYLAGLSARPGSARWLHLHWPEWMTHHPSRWKYHARTRWLLGLLDVARARGVRVAWTAHNLFGHDDPHPDLGSAARRALLARCDVVFGHFPSAERDVRELGFKGRFALTPHPHYDDDYPRPFRDARARDEYRRSLGVREGEVLLVSPGSMEPYKNLPRVACALVESGVKGVRWVVAGRSRHPHVLESLRALEREHAWLSVREGFVPRPELASLIAAADAALLGYRAFYTSGAAVLALTLETPVIGPPEHHLATLTDEPFFVPLPAVDAPSMRAAVERVRAITPDDRARAREYSLRTGWDDVADTVAATLWEDRP